MTIDQCVVKHILVDTGSFINSFFTNNFNQMGISWNHVLPYAALLVGFFGQTTNNKAEYEALFAALRMTKTLKLIHILVRSDSQEKEDNIKKYLLCVQHIIPEFSTVQFEKAATKWDAHYKGKWPDIITLKSDIPKLKEGDLVLRKNEISQVDPNRKLDLIWEGPYQVIKVNGHGSYRLQDSEGKILAKTWNDVSFRKFFP
ncbi:hypothetical protein M9H77_31850 [Catharanthus roseus]|uniref:Uncharacterized protein n=1 Tax=Catharanthus roseus TaxID=4058 RepID=A0ACC0A3K6_CATRO|nr:hypothetical protein M9H77_31850 [Catharanthus roseus]